MAYSTTFDPHRQLLQPAGRRPQGCGPRGQASPLRADHPLVGPLHDLEGEATVTPRGDHQPAARVGGIGLHVAVPAQGNQLVEIEVRAPLGALGDMVHVEAGPDVARLTGPAGAGQDLGADLLPLLEASGWATGRQGPPGAYPPTGGLPNADPIPKPPQASHALRPGFAHVGKMRCLTRRSPLASVWRPGAPTPGDIRGTRPGRWQWDWGS